MKDQKYKFSKKAHSKGGRDATIMAVIAALLFAASILLSYFMDGKAGSYVGGLALVTALTSVYGFAIGMNSFKEKEVSPALSIVGSISCGIIMVAHLTLFLAGIR